MYTNKENPLILELKCNCPGGNFSYENAPIIECLNCHSYFIIVNNGDLIKRMEEDVAKYIIKKLGRMEEQFSSSWDRFHNRISSLETENKVLSKRVEQLEWRFCRIIFLVFGLLLGFLGTSGFLYWFFS